MPDRSRVMTQTKRDTLVLQVGGFDVGPTTAHSKKLTVMKVEQREKLDRFNDDGLKRTKDTNITLATWNVQAML
jgi:hypothetical protein